MANVERLVTCEAGMAIAAPTEIKDVAYLDIPKTLPPSQPLCFHICLLIAVQAIFAGNGLVCKLMLNKGTNVFVFSFVRDALAGILMLVIAKVCGRLQMPTTSIRDVAWLILLGVLGLSAGVLYLISLEFVRPATASLSQLLLPVLTPMVAACTGLEDMFHGGCLRSSLRFLGLIVCVAGAAASIASKQSLGGRWLGYLILVPQVLCGCCYASAMKYVLNLGRWEPLPLVAWEHIAGAIIQFASPALTLGFGGFLMPLSNDAWIFDSGALMALAYTVCLTSVVNYSAMAVVNQKLGPSLVMAFSPLQPILTELFQPLLGLGNVSVFDMCTTAVVLCGLGIFLGSQMRTNEARERLGDANCEPLQILGDRLIENDTVDGGDGGEFQRMDLEHPSTDKYPLYIPSVHA
jgi:drug/metabolite transporter (DMT)-like permease